jgi:hypothetical protein
VGQDAINARFSRDSALLNLKRPPPPTPLPHATTTALVIVIVVHIVGG